MSEAAVAPTDPLLSVEELSTCFRTPTGEVTALDRISFTLPSGGSLGLVGESGSGKSVTALSIARLLPDPPARIAGGRVLFEGRDLLALDEPKMCEVRGDRLTMIFQEPMTSLNPVVRVGDQVGEPLVLHRSISRKEARARAVELFRKVGIADPERRVLSYPHELSGGMRQRVMIAMAIACGPRLIIADEPTTALDVTIQAQILALLSELRRETGSALLLITHDLGVVAETCDEVVVLYAGQVVERATAAELFAAPRHPYTAGLLRSIPPFDLGLPTETTPNAIDPPARLVEIPGVVPRLAELPAGCRFATRCERVQERCRAELPPLIPAAQLVPGERSDRLVRCFFPVVEART
jgi:peptide/nickel transport system ATP-binding protein